MGSFVVEFCGTVKNGDDNMLPLLIGVTVCRGEST